MTHESDAHLPMFPEEAVSLARRLTNGRMRIQANGHGVFLTHIEKRGEVHLLPYQLTALNIERIISENDPWLG